MSKNPSVPNGDGTSSKFEHNTPSKDGNSLQDDKYTFKDSDKGSDPTPKVHEFVEKNFSEGTVKEGGRGENFKK